MTSAELAVALQNLDSDSRKALLLEILPDLAREALQDQAFLLRLFPVFLELLQQSGLDPQHLLQMAGLISTSDSAGLRGL